MIPDTQSNCDHICTPGPCGLRKCGLEEQEGDF